jgi:hypothetical protein
VPYLREKNTLKWSRKVKSVHIEQSWKIRKKGNGTGIDEACTLNSAKS